MTKTIRLLLLTIFAVGLSVSAIADSGSFYNPYAQCDINWDCGDQCSTGWFFCTDMNDCSTCAPVCQDCAQQ
jgi:hypothetical protein